MQLILASSSPARLETLRRAGITALVARPEVDEEAVAESSPAALVATLARMKAEAVLARPAGSPSGVPLAAADEWVLVACDTLLELDGRPWGKPGSSEAVVALWQRMRGRTALLHTGHHVVVHARGTHRALTRVATTSVTFADLDDAEIRAYAATGEPQKVAGGFTIDSLGGPFVTSIQGDPHNVVGISLPLVRQMLLDLGVAWHDLWAPTTH